MPRTPARPQKHSGLRMLASGVLALIVLQSLVVQFWPESAAHAVDEVARAVPTASLVVAPATPVLEREADTFRFSVMLKNPTDQPISEGIVTLSIDAEPQFIEAPLDATDAAASVANETPAEPAQPIEIVVRDLPATAEGSEQTLEISVPRAEMPQVAARPDGVYRLHAEFVANNAGQSIDQPADLGAEPSTEPGTDTTADAPTDEANTEVAASPLTASTLLVWGQITAPATSVTLVVPLVLPGSVQTMPTSDDLATIAPRLLRLLTNAEQHMATIAVDPRIIAGTRALGTSAPATARQLVERLESSLSPIFLLQFADADPAAQAALGFETLVQPLGLDYVTSLGTFDALANTNTDTDTNANTDTAAQSDTSAEPEAGQPEAEGDAAAPETDQPIDSADPGAAEDTTSPEDDSTDPPLADGVPTLEQLVSLENARLGAWPASGQVNAATLGLLSSAGLTSLVLSSTSVNDATGTRVTMPGFEALISDADLERAAADAIEAASQTEYAAGLSNLAAQLALAAQQGDTGTVIALDRAAIAQAGDAADFFEAFDALGWVRVVPESLQPEGTATLRSGETSETRRELLRSSLQRSDQIDRLGALLEHPEYMHEYQRVRMLELLSTRYAGSDVDFAEVSDLSRSQDEELLLAVRPITTDNTQLVGTSSRVPITLSSTLPFDSIVSLQAVPTSAAISVSEQRFETTVPALGNTAVLVPVSSRVSSGESGLLLEVSDLSGEVVVGSDVQQLTLRTTIETTIMVVLGSAAVLLVSFGIWRSVRRRRSKPQPDLSLAE